MAKIRDESNAQDDADLPRRDREAGREKIAETRTQEDRGGFSVGGRDNEHPDGWNPSR
jgi:hypothetical protein